MAEFINTIDRLGDDVVMDGIIQRTIAEFKDDVLDTVARYAFANCNELKVVDLPNVETIMQRSFENCTSLERVDMLNLKQIHSDANNGYAFSGCTNLSEFNAPNVEYIGHQAFGYCKKLRVYNFPKATELLNWAFSGCGIVCAKFPLVTKMSDNAFTDCTSLKVAYFPLVDYGMSNCFKNCNDLEIAILGNPTKLDGNAFQNATKCNLILPNKSKVTQCTATSAIDSLLAIYVPSSLLADYKAATNWSNYTNKIFAIESSEQILSWLGDRYVVDGTVEFSCYTVSNVLSRVTSDNNKSITGNSYRATLTADRNYILQEVTIAMGGIDVTSQVYNAETGEVIISSVTGDIVIRATAEKDPNYVPPPYAVELTPYNGSEEGELPFYKLDVTAGMTLELEYLLTRTQGYIYDGRNCGMQYYGSVNGSAYPMNVTELNTPTVLTITIPSNGKISFSGNRNDSVANGELSPFSSDRLYGKYLYVKIL